MSFGTGISETNSDYCTAPPSLVWVNGNAHLIVMVNLHGGSPNYKLRDYTVYLDLTNPTSPGLPTTRGDVTAEGPWPSWNPGTPTAVYDPNALQLLYLYVDIHGEVCATYSNGKGNTTLMGANGNGFALITAPDGFVVITSAADWSEVSLTPYTWQGPTSSPTYLAGTPLSVETGTLFDAGTSVRGAVVMSSSSATGYDYTLTLGLMNSSDDTVTFAQVPINLDPFGVSTVDGWTTTPFAGARLSGLCLAPDGLPIGLINNKSDGSVQFIHFSPDSGWSLNNQVGWETSGTQISTLSGVDPLFLSLGYYFCPPTATASGVSTEVYQLIAKVTEYRYVASIENIGALTRTDIPPQPGNQNILLGIVEGPPPVPLENTNLPATVSPGWSAAASTTCSNVASGGTSQTITNQQGFLLQASGEAGFGIGLQVSLEFQINYSQIQGATQMNTVLNSEPLSLQTSGSAGQYEIEPTGWLLIFESDFGAHVYQFTGLSGDVLGLSYAQVYSANPRIKYQAYTINTTPAVDLTQRPYLPPTPGDLSTYYPGDQDAQAYYGALALQLLKGSYLYDNWTVSVGQAQVKEDWFSSTTMSSIVTVDLQTMVGDKFGPPFVFGSATISAGFKFDYSNAQTDSSTSDIGVQVSLGPMAGTLTETPYQYSAYDTYGVNTYQLTPNQIYADWLFADCATDPALSNLVPGSQPWKIVYLVVDSTVNQFAILAPVVPPSTSGWSGDLNTASCPNPPWIPGYQVRYAVSFYGGSEPNNPDWESPKGAWTDWLSNAGYCRAILQGIPVAPTTWTWDKGIGRKVYRQFLGSSPEYICNIPDNITTTFVDPVSPGQCGA